MAAEKFGQDLQVFGAFRFGNRSEVAAPVLPDYAHLVVVGVFDGDDLTPPEPARSVPRSCAALADIGPLPRAHGRRNLIRPAVGLVIEQDNGSVEAHVIFPLVWGAASWNRAA